MFWKPLVTLIWLGALVMAFGGALSLSDRRLRIGFARRAARGASTAAIRSRRNEPMRRGSLARLGAAAAALAAGAGRRGAARRDAARPEARGARPRRSRRELRCLVCQNQSIDNSAAPLARDLRLLVRERLKAGDSDAAVHAYLVARYGDFVLLKPPFKPETLLLWLAPPAVLLVGAALIVATRRSAGPRRSDLPLDAAEQAKVDALMESG